MDFKKTPGHDTRAGLALAKINRLTLNMTSVSTDAGSHKALNSRKMAYDPVWKTLRVIGPSIYDLVKI